MPSKLQKNHRGATRPTLGKRAWSALGLLLLCGTAVNKATAFASPGLPGSNGLFLYHSGQQLLFNGHPTRFVGFNRYDAAGGPLAQFCQHTVGPQAYTSYIADLMSAAKSAGAAVLRMWAFQNFAGPDGTDFSGIDEVRIMIFRSPAA